MRELASNLSFVLGLLTRIHPRSGFGKLLVWIPKLLGSALSPILAVAGMIGFLTSLVQRKPRAALSGLLGALLNATHILKVTQESSSLALAFGVDYESRIPPQIFPRLKTARWSLPTYPTLEPHWKQDLIVASHPPTGEPLLADLWLPPEGTKPTGMGIIYLHGSAWHYGDKDVGTRPFFRHLAGQGHVILDLAYVLAPAARVNGMLADVDCAIQWMKSNGVKYGIRPDRIVLMGGSAGGHLALLAAYKKAEGSTPDSSVCGVVSYYGITDLVALTRYLENLYKPESNCAIDRVFMHYYENFSDGLIVHPKDLLPNLLSGTYEKMPDQYRAASPIHHVGPHCPPTLQIFGAHDIAGVQQGILRLHQALVAAKVPSVYIEIPDCDHGFDLVFPQISPTAQTATYYTERFLAILSSDSD